MLYKMMALPNMCTVYLYSMDLNMRLEYPNIRVCAFLFNFI